MKRIRTEPHNDRDEGDERIRTGTCLFTAVVNIGHIVNMVREHDRLQDDDGSLCSLDATDVLADLAIIEGRA